MSLVSSCTDETNNYTIVQEESYKAMQIEAVASLVENISRQPEMKDQLLGSFSKVVGYKQFSDLAPFDSEEEAMVGTRRGEAIAACMTAMARQPEMVSYFTDFSVVMLGE